LASTRGGSKLSPRLLPSLIEQHKTKSLRQIAEVYEVYPEAVRRALMNIPSDGL